MNDSMFSYYFHLVIAQSAPFMFVGFLQPAAGFFNFHDCQFEEGSELFCFPSPPNVYDHSSLYYTG
jgi:hypothetical protein